MALFELRQVYDDRNIEVICPIMHAGMILDWIVVGAAVFEIHFKSCEDCSQLRQIAENFCQ